MKRLFLKNDRAIWVVLALLAAIFFIRFPLKFLQEPPFLMDFSGFHVAAQRILRGEAEKLYQPLTTERQVWKYSPTWGILLSPLGLLPLNAGAVVWSTLNVVWLILTLWLGFRAVSLGGLTSRSFVPLVVVGLLTRPLSAEFLNGQLDLLWAFLLAAFLFLELKGRPWGSSLFWAAATSLKLPSGIFLPYWVFRRQWALLGRAWLCLLLFNGLGALFLNTKEPVLPLIQWAQALKTIGPVEAFDIGSQSLLAALGRFLTADPLRLNIANLSRSAVLGAALLLELGLLLAVCRAPGGMEPKQRKLLDASMLMVLMLLASPSAWIATFSLLIVPFFAAIGGGLRLGKKFWKNPVVMAALGVTLAADLLTHKGIWKKLGIVYFRGESYLFLVFMIFTWLGLGLFLTLWLERSALARKGTVLKGLSPSGLETGTDSD